jgi:uncharacterized membrane protein SpoIIM required for sporulation
MGTLSTGEKIVQALDKAQNINDFKEMLQQQTNQERSIEALKIAIGLSAGGLLLLGGVAIIPAAILGTIVGLGADYVIDNLPVTPVMTDLE